MKNASEATGFLSLNRPGIRLGGVFCSCLMTELDVRPNFDAFYIGDH